MIGHAIRLLGAGTGRPRRGGYALQGLAGAVLGAVAARTAYTLLTRPGPETTGPAAAPGGDPGRDRWLRSNFRGRSVTLQEGPALASGVCAASLFTPGLAPRVRAASALAAAGAAAFGAYDDLAGSVRARGLRGHLGALARGRVTTGAVKVLGIGVTGVAAAALLRRPFVDTVLDGALIAASANLVNLFDLRPGRAAKVCLIAAAPALASPAAPLLGPVVGAAAVLLPDDLAERSMLGDTGANALGAALGVAAVARAPRPVRLALLGGAVALTLASERVSFSRCIDRVPALRRLDQWGRSAPESPIGDAGGQHTDRTDPTPVESGHTGRDRGQGSSVPEQVRREGVQGSSAGERLGRSAPEAPIGAGGGRGPRGSGSTPVEGGRLGRDGDSGALPGGRAGRSGSGASAEGGGG
ncbi:hypothetical protein HNR10_005216 [Nocardiopsis aegyptia]|uniref:UDP-N-acetylmuramyl pentapeptide phosphotransferase/UDP-N-acetylglucosamine-1-phosphate transferase n=1 Tax=Nocardiopsis aegyptia TaxID=220378 RepID=A0A7Z0JDC9_9ACTN|nr:hypothetical protein [Nocardiopsis aegyptia]